MNPARLTEVPAISNTVARAVYEAKAMIVWVMSVVPSCSPSWVEAASRAPSSPPVRSRLEMASSRLRLRLSFSTMSWEIA